jgi:hypothetical protein
LSGTRNCTAQTPIPINEDHMGIVKPCSMQDDSYIALRNAVVAIPIAPTPAPTPAPRPAPTKADVILKFEGRDGLFFYLLNAPKAETARDPKYAFGIWDLDSDSVRDPLPIPTRTATGDFILPGGLMGPFGIMSGPESINRRGHRLFGFAISLCSNCAGQHDYWISFRLGVGGWYAPQHKYPTAKLPDFVASLAESRSTEALEPLAPTNTRLPIQ